MSYTLALVFAMSLGASLLACEWQSARERGHLTTLGILTAVGECLEWFPLYVAIGSQDQQLVAASIVGSVIGAVWGGARERRRARAEAAHCTCCIVHCDDADFKRTLLRRAGVNDRMIDLVEARDEAMK